MNRQPFPLVLLLAGLALSLPTQTRQTPEASERFQQAFSSAPERVWRAALETIEAQKGVILARDPASRLFSARCRLEKKDFVYHVNVLVLPDPAGTGCTVCFTTYHWSGRFSIHLDREFFQALEKRLAEGGHEE